MEEIKKEKRGGWHNGGRPEGYCAKQAEIIKQDLTSEFIKHKHEIYVALINKAKRGNMPAIKELLDRVAGRPTEHIDVGVNKALSAKLDLLSKLLN